MLQEIFIALAYASGFKICCYKVIAVAKHSETLEELVVYEAMYKNPLSNVWVRPLKMFLEKVEIKGKEVPRFKYVEE